MALSGDEMKFIRENAKNYSSHDLALLLNRNVGLVERYMQQMGIKDPSGAKNEDVPHSTIIGALRSKPFYGDLKKQLGQDELQSFELQWVSIIQQFDNNILPSEELELKELLVYECLKNRALTEEKEVLDARVKVKLRISALTKNKDAGTITSDERRELHELNQMQLAYGASLKDIRGIFKDLADKSTKVRQSLTDARSKRTQDLDKLKLDFSALVKALQDWEFRKRFAREAEVLRAVKDKATDDLTKLYEFGEKKIPDFPVYNSEVIEDVKRRNFGAGSRSSDLSAPPNEQGDQLSSGDSERGKGDLPEGGQEPA